MPLVYRDQVAQYLRRTVNPGSADMACRVAEGWLRAATRLTDWPAPAPGDLTSWAVELAAIAYDNPTGLSRAELGTASREWWMGRRAEILDAARRAYGPASGGPQGAFPAAQWWPDPSVPRGWPCST